MNFSVFWDVVVHNTWVLRLFGSHLQMTNPVRKEHGHTTVISDPTEPPCFHFQEILTVWPEPGWLKSIPFADPRSGPRSLPADPLLHKRARAQPAARARRRHSKSCSQLLKSGSFRCANAASVNNDRLENVYAERAECHLLRGIMQLI